MAVLSWNIQTTTPIQKGPSEWTFEEIVLVEVADPKMANRDIERDPRFPTRFSLHPARPEFWCVDTILEQPLQHPNIRPLRIHYSTVIPKGFNVNGKPTYDDNPLLRPADIWWGTYKTNKLFRMGYLASDSYDPRKGMPTPSVPIVTTAGEPIFTQEQVDLRVISFVKNVATIPGFMAKRGNFVNTDKVKINGIEFKPYELMATDINIPPPDFESGKMFYKFSWNFYVSDDEDGWVVKKRNAGFNERVTVHYDHDRRPVPLPVRGGSTTVVLRPIVVGPVDNRHYPSSPVLLRENGRAFRTRAEGDGDDPETWTGEIMTIESRQDDERTQVQKDEDWKKAELKFRIRAPIAFNKYFPMR